MRVFRVENECGDGPYVADWPGDYEMVSRHNCNTERWPGVKPDVAACENGKPWDYYWPEASEVCACDSIDKLKQWFHGFRRPLHEAGFVVAEYEVPEEAVKHGVSGKQLLFDRDQAVLVTNHKLIAR